MFVVAWNDKIRGRNVLYICQCSVITAWGGGGKNKNIEGN